MSENTSDCNHDCGSCSNKCENADLHIPQGEYSKVKKVIGVVSGKGGVGKSLVTSLLAISAKARGNRVAILDADVTGPSIPKAFGIKTKVKGTDIGMIPERSKLGIDIMSINLLLEEDTAPVVWRGPVISGVIQQFWRDVAWGEVDYMFVDMPPGTGDVPLTVYQSLPIDGIVIVTTPQDLVTMIVTKAYNMAKMMNIPVIGIVENMSYVKCPDCGKNIELFGKSKAEEVAKELGTTVLAKLPIDSKTAELVDNGSVELADDSMLKNAIERIIDFTKE
ncbi:MAG: Mrp/NBP35 family ATP-binding protein [Oscillospiraceae bacterium]